MDDKESDKDLRKLFWIGGIIILLFLLLAIWVILEAKNVSGESVTTNVNVVTGVGFCSISTPSYLNNFDCNSNTSTTIPITQVYNTTNVTYALVQNMSVINLSDRLVLNLSCPQNVSVDNMSGIVSIEVGKIKDFISEYMNSELLPSKDELDQLKDDNLKLNDSVKDLTMKLNVSEINNNNLVFQNDQLRDDKNKAWIMFFICLGCLAVVVFIFTGMLEKLGLSRPKMNG